MKKTLTVVLVSLASIFGFGTIQAMEFKNSNQATPLISAEEKTAISKEVVSDVFKSRGIAFTEENIQDPRITKREMSKTVGFMFLLHLKCEKCYTLTVLHSKETGTPISVESAKRYLDSQAFLNRISKK